MQSQVHLIPLCLLGNGVTVYGFRYPGLLNCLSWCYLTIAKNVVIATQPKNDCGTSLTNTWSKAFFELVGVAFGSLESSAGRRHNWHLAHRRGGYPSNGSKRSRAAKAR